MDWLVLFRCCLSFWVSCCCSAAVLWLWLCVYVSLILAGVYPGFGGCSCVKLVVSVSYYYTRLRGECCSELRIEVNWACLRWCEVCPVAKPLDSAVMECLDGLYFLCRCSECNGSGCYMLFTALSIVHTKTLSTAKHWLTRHRSGPGRAA